MPQLSEGGLPDLSRLCLCEDGNGAKGEDAARGSSERKNRWFRELAGDAEPPDWKPWEKVSSKDKAVFREMADRSENDRFSRGQYLAPYSGDDIDSIIDEETWSIEHILPRSRINGSSEGAGEDDPFGWVVETRRENGRRRNLPLVLWKTGATDGELVYINGVKHYDFADGEKGRVARKWIYIRAIYGNTIDPMTDLQQRHLDDILKVAAEPLGFAEKKFHSLLVDWVAKTYQKNWHNPLLDEEDRLEILQDKRFLALLHQSDARQGVTQGSTPLEEG